MYLTLTIGVCAFVAVFGAVAIYLILSRITARADETGGVSYSVLRPFLRKNDAPEVRQADDPVAASRGNALSD